MNRKINHPTLKERVYGAILEMITAGELSPKEKIVEQKLAEKLGVSRTPVQAALTRLVHDGLLEEKPRLGVFVKELYSKELLDIYEVREVVEGLAARRAAAVATVETIEELHEILKRASEYYESNDYERYRKTDLDFHMRLAEISGNEIILKIIRRFHLQVNSIRSGVFRSVSETLSEHLEIVNALEIKDSDLCERLVRSHIKKTQEKIQDILNKRMKFSNATTIPIRNGTI